MGALRRVLVDLAHDVRYGLRSLRRYPANRTSFEVVGVVGNTTYGALAEARGEPRSLVYLPLYQFMLDGPISVTVRHDASPAALAVAARTVMAAIDPALPVYQVRTFEQLVADSLLQSDSWPACRPHLPSSRWCWPASGSTA